MRDHDHGPAAGGREGIYAECGLNLDLQLGSRTEVLGTAVDPVVKRQAQLVTLPSPDDPERPLHGRSDR